MTQAEFEKEFWELEKIFPVCLSHGVGSLDCALGWEEAQVYFVTGENTRR